MNIPDVFRNYPAATIAALRGLALAGLTLAVAFGLKLTPDQQTAILEFGAALTGVALLFSIGTVAATVPKAPTASAPPSAIQLDPAPPAPKG